MATTNALKIVCPTLEWVVRSFTVFKEQAWSAHGHSSDWWVVRSSGVNIIHLLVPPGLGSTCLWAACT